MTDVMDKPALKPEFKVDTMIAQRLHCIKALGSVALFAPIIPSSPHLFLHPIQYCVPFHRYSIRHVQGLSRQLCSRERSRA